MNTKITQQQLHSVLDYEHDTGIFTWKIAHGRWGTLLPGDEQNTRKIHINGYGYYQRHVLAWFYVYGVWPSSEIDHIDRNSQNTAISNLREATRSQNEQNKIVRSDSSTGIKGVQYRQRRKGYTASLKIDGKKYSGCFATEEEAIAHRAALVAAHHPYAPQGFML